MVTFHIPVPFRKNALHTYYIRNTKKSNGTLRVNEILTVSGIYFYTLCDSLCLIFCVNIFQFLSGKVPYRATDLTTLHTM